MFNGHAPPSRMGVGAAIEEYERIAATARFRTTKDAKTAIFAEAHHFLNEVAGLKHGRGERRTYELAAAPRAAPTGQRFDNRSERFTWVSGD